MMSIFGLSEFSIGLKKPIQNANGEWNKATTKLIHFMFGSGFKDCMFEIIIKKKKKKNGKK